MKTRETWILLAVALALGAYIRFVDLRRPLAVPAAEGSRVRFSLAAAGSARSLELHWSNLVLRVNRTGTTWRLNHPVDARALSAPIDALVAGLESLQPSSFIGSADLNREPGGLAAFGLQPPQATLILEHPAGRIALHLGRKTPAGDQFYLQRDGEPGVYVAHAALLRLLPETPHSWRDRQILDFRAADADSIEIRGARELRAEREGPGPGWRLTSPLAARADSDRVQTTLNSLLELEAREFVADRPIVDPEAYGLAPPAAEVLVRRGSNLIAHVQFGNSPTNTPGLVYLRNLLQTNVTLVPAESAGWFRQPAAAYRDRNIAPRLAGASTIYFSVSTNITRLEREGTNWWVSQPHRFPADPGIVRLLLAELGSLQVAEFLADVAPDPGLYGLDGPTREFAVHATETNALGVRSNLPLLQLQIGKPLSNNPALVSARRLDEPGIFALPKTDFRLPETANQLRDWSFHPTNVVEITSTHSNRVRSLRRIPGGWSGLPGTVLPEALDETLFRLSKWSSIRYAIRDVPAFTRMYRFENRQHELLLRFRPGSGPLNTWKLQFGADLGDDVVTLVHFDDDAIPLHLKLPRGIYEELYRAMPPP